MHDAIIRKSTATIQLTQLAHEKSSRSYKRCNMVGPHLYILPKALAQLDQVRCALGVKDAKLSRLPTIGKQNGPGILA